MAPASKGCYDCAMEKLTSYLGFEARFVVYPVLAILAAGLVRLFLKRYLYRWAEKSENKADDRIVAYLDNIIAPLLLISIFYWLSGLLPLPGKIVVYLHRGLLVLGILLTAFFSARLISSLLALYASLRDGRQTILKPFRTLSNVLFALIAIVFSLKALNVDMTGQGIQFVRVIGIIAGAFVITRIIGIAVVQFEHLVESAGSPIGSEAQKRARTIGKIISNAALVLVISVSGMMILSEFGMNIAPIITGAGIVGLAVGFGAQNLVRDVISGFFLILEDQLRVGDVVRINGVSGTVETIRLRTTTLRDPEGIVHIIPNGGVTFVSNMTKGHSYSVIDVGVSYKERVDDVMEVLKQIGAELEADVEFSPLILAPLEVLGVENFEESQVTIRIRIKTLPQRQWAVGRELRRRIKNTFDSKNIEIPFPQRTIHLQNEK